MPFNQCFCLLTLSFRYIIREDEFYVLLNCDGQIRVLKKVWVWTRH